MELFYRVVKDCIYVFYVVLFFFAVNLRDEMEVIGLVVDGIKNVLEVCVKIKGIVKRVVVISFVVVIYGEKFYRFLDVIILFLLLLVYTKMKLVFGLFCI